MPRVHLIQYLRYFYYHWVDTSDGGVLVSESMTRCFCIDMVY
jgi:hypothetical protein